MAFDPTKRSLGELIAPLAEELYKMIHDLTFATPESPITITEDYQPPSTAQVSRATRKMYLAEYLKKTFHGEAVDIIKWIASFADEHRAMLMDVRAWYDPDADEEEETEAGRRLPGQNGIRWISSLYWPMEWHALLRMLEGVGIAPEADAALYDSEAKAKSPDGVADSNRKIFAEQNAG